MYNSRLHEVWQYHSDRILYCRVYIMWHCTYKPISRLQTQPIIEILLLTCTCRKWLNWTRGLFTPDFYHLNMVCTVGCIHLLSPAAVFSLFMYCVACQLLVTLGVLHSCHPSGSRKGTACPIGLSNNLLTVLMLFR